MINTAVATATPHPAPVYDDVDVVMKMNRKNCPMASPDSGVTLNINLVYEEADYSAKNFYIYNEDTFMGGHVSEYSDDGHSIILNNLSPATYTIMAAFDELISHPGTPWTRCYVFAENIEVNDDMSVNMEAASAVNQFIGKSFLPNGEEARLDNNGYDENFEPRFIPGNCLNKLIQTTIFDTKYNTWIASLVGSTGTYDMDNVYGLGIHWRLEEMYNIMVNDISDNILICQQRDNYTEDGIVATVAYSKGTDNLLLCNNPSNFRSIEESFTHTPAFGIYGSPDDKYQFTCLGFKNWSYFLYPIIPWIINTPFTMSFSSSDNEPEFSDFHPYYRFQLNDAVVDWTEYNLKGQRFAFDEDGAFYSFSNFYAQADFSGVCALDENNQEVYYDFPGNPGLEVQAYSPISYIYGNSASLNTINPLVYKQADKFITNLNPSFQGLLGEDRAADKIGLDVSVSHDEEVVLTDGQDWNRFWNENPNKSPDGVYVARFENNSNIMVDDIAGYNVTNLSFSYEREDICPPAIQALQFRDNDNIFAQRFKTVDDVNIIVCAGDYAWFEDEDYICYNYISKPLNVDVSIATHDSEVKDWMPVVMNEVKEFGNLAGYGCFFRGSLSDSDINAIPGWYDIRIEVTDEAGNSNLQILGPAFYVDNVTGMDNIVINNSDLVYENGVISSADGEAYEFMVYSSEGQLRLSERAPRISLVGFEKGIYFVTARTNHGIVSKKIVI